MSHVRTLSLRLSLTHYLTPLFLVDEYDLAEHSVGCPLKLGWMNSNIRDKGVTLVREPRVTNPSRFVSGHIVLHNSAIFVLYD